MAYCRFLLSRTGIIKLLEVIVGIVTLVLVVTCGFTVMQYADLLNGSAFLLAVVSVGLIVSFIELVTFFYDDETLYGVRKSYFEVVFCFVSAALWIAAGCTMAYLVHVYGRKNYKVTNDQWEMYPGLVAATVFTFIGALLYLIDTILAFGDVRASGSGGGPRYLESVVYK